MTYKQIIYQAGKQWNNSSDKDRHAVELKSLLSKQATNQIMNLTRINMPYYQTTKQATNQTI